MSFHTYGLTIVAGAHNLQFPDASWQTVNFASFRIHEGYSSFTFNNDIAVVKLEKSVNFNSYVQPVCLPSLGEVVASGTEGIIAGWGTTSEGGLLSLTLQEVAVPVVEPSECSRLYEGAGVFINDSSMICAAFAEGGKDSCQGDSGGPFVIKKNDTSTLQGIVSFGVGCARPGYPGVYTRVANYIDWIENTINN